MPDKSNPYEEAAEVLLRESGCTVRKYRSSNSGEAFTSSKDWGIEVPRPRGPMSFAVFAHEVGHQMLHRGNESKPRWLEEIEATEYALAQFERFRLDGAEEAKKREARNLRHSAKKANRRATPETAQAILDRYPEWAWEV